MNTVAEVVVKRIKEILNEKKYVNLSFRKNHSNVSQHNANTHESGQ